MIYHVSAVGAETDGAIADSAVLRALVAVQILHALEAASATRLPLGLKTGMDYCETAPFFFKEAFDTFGFLPSEDEV
jgi:hypothetical protein